MSVSIYQTLMVFVAIIHTAPSMGIYGNVVWTMDLRLIERYPGLRTNEARESHDPRGAGEKYYEDCPRIFATHILLSTFISFL